MGWALASVLVHVLARDELEHRLVAKAALGAFFAQLVDQVLLEHDRSRQGLADRPEAASGPDVVSEIPTLEFLDLPVALSGLLRNHFRVSLPHRASLRFAAFGGSCWAEACCHVA